MGYTGSIECVRSVLFWHRLRELETSERNAMLLASSVCEALGRQTSSYRLASLNVDEVFA